MQNVKLRPCIDYKLCFGLPVCDVNAEQERRDPALSRGDYVGRLAKDLKEYYGYLRELIDMFLIVSCRVFASRVSSC